MEDVWDTFSSELEDVTPAIKIHHEKYIKVNTYVRHVCHTYTCNVHVCRVYMICIHYTMSCICRVHVCIVHVPFPDLLADIPFSLFHSAISLAGSCPFLLPSFNPCIITKKFIFNQIRKISCFRSSFFILIYMMYSCDHADCQIKGLILLLFLYLLYLLHSSSSRRYCPNFL